MRSLVVCLLTAFAVVVLPQLAAAQPPGGPPRPGPEMLMKHLDKDQDGAISADEASKVPERLQAMLKRADKDGDKKVTADELAEAFKQFREHAAGMHRPGQGPPGRRPGPPPGTGRPGPPPGAMRRPLPDPKEVFAKLDKNGDKQLSLEEFAEGMRKLHAARRGGPPQMRRPGPPPQMRRPGPPPQMRRGGPPCARRPGGPPMGRPGMGPGMGPHRGRPGKGPGPHGRGPAAAAERFKAADANKDGKLSKDEAPERLKQHFDKIDADKDGQLTPDEIRKAFAAMMKERAKKAAEARKAGPNRPAKSPSDKKDDKK